MEKISQFDLVILLGDPDDITNLNGTKTKILYHALTTVFFLKKFFSQRFFRLV